MTLLRRAAAVGLLLLAAGCAAEAQPSPVATNQVNLPPSYRFDPEVITVPAGTTVTWTNNDNFTHNVRLLDDGGDVLQMAPGQSVSFTFEEPGEHRYDCSLHPNDMQGMVIVTQP
ncbi:MAG TPA: plastocyanin/azurin family copper-binding protein [candidate division Zixibacteria bacterium]|nr:plastocyanin/azurin family copper-binding protein [candidate division Zixibacteria bacterium]